MVDPQPGTILRFRDKTFKVSNLDTVKCYRWAKDSTGGAFREVAVPAVRVQEANPLWAGWSETRYMHLSYWKSMCTRGAFELPADWQPSSESREQQRNRERCELLDEIKPSLTAQQYRRLLELL